MQVLCVLLHITLWASGSMWATSGDAGLVPSVGQTRRVPHMEPVGGCPVCWRLEITSWHGQGAGADREGPREGQGDGEEVDRATYQLPPLLRPAVPQSHTHSHRPRSPARHPGLSPPEKPPAGCTSPRTPLVVKPSISPVRSATAARSWDHRGIRSHP